MTTDTTREQDAEIERLSLERQGISIQIRKPTVQGVAIGAIEVVLPDGPPIHLDENGRQIGSRNA